MSSIKLSESARSDLLRLYEFLAQFDVSVADNSNAAIIAGLEYLALHPLNGAPVEDRPHTRKMVVDFGASGYLIFHKRYEKQDMNLVTRILHQKEWYDTDSIGAEEEAQES